MALRFTIDPYDVVIPSFILKTPADAITPLHLGYLDSLPITRCALPRYTKLPGFGAKVKYLF